jgi:hypothetical protein
MRALGAVAFPGARTGDTFKDIQTKCNEYAKQKALEDFAASGKISNLTTLQADIDACAAGLDRGRQIRQGMILTVGLGIAGYVGFWAWRQR